MLISINMAIYEKVKIEDALKEEFREFLFIFIYSSVQVEEETFLFLFPSGARLFSPS